MQGKCCLAIKLDKSANGNCLGAIYELGPHTSASFSPFYASKQKLDEKPQIACQTSR